MSLHELTAISPIDGRYRKKINHLENFFSEQALMRYRVHVEVEYFIALCDIPLPNLSALTPEQIGGLRGLYIAFSQKSALRIKEIEQETNHDVKAVEYFIKEQLPALNLEKQGEFIHFGLTSQDVNNTAIPLSIKDAEGDAYLSALDSLIHKLQILSNGWKDIPMLARTHGQPASPTRLGKEIKVFVERLQAQENQLKAIPHSAKFGGATGNFNAHHVAYPKINWVEFANRFVHERLGLQRSQTTTQIEHYDNLAARFDAMRRINTILIDLCRDFWLYVSMDYFKQKIKAGEVGSSAMPHKVNPIDFENAEGNLGIANAIFGHLSEKLPVSRLQRDLTDSTVLRNVGVPFAHSIISFKAIEKGLDKLLLNEQKIKRELEDNWAVVAEALQTILRREAYPHPYEELKKLTRTNTAITRETIANFINQLKVSDAVKEEMHNISPWSYTGINEQ